MNASKLAGVGLALGLILALSACNRIDTEPATEASETSGASEAPARTPTANQPDVLVVTIDTLRADHVGVYGGDPEMTPHLDALAAEGVRFETAMAVAPLTLPSHATLFTGQLPIGHGVRHNGVYTLDDTLPTLAERLRDAGLRTGAVVSAMVLREDTGIARGFDHFDDAPGSRKNGPGGFWERPANEVTDAALAWLERQDGPVFLWAHYYDPHATYQAPEAFDRRFPGHPYGAEVAFVDAELQRLVDAIDARRGERRAPLVAVTSDHGEALGEHGEATHSHTLYDATLAVPWVLRGAGLPEGRVVEGVTGGADFAPTLLGWLGLPALAPGTGRDLSAVIRGEAVVSGEPAYSETLATRIEFGWAPLFSLRSDTHRYVDAPRPELYDVVADPAELENLHDTGAPSPLRAALATLRKDDDESPPSTHAIDDETRMRLEALGYAIPEERPPDLGIDPKDGIAAKAKLDAGIERFQAADFDGAIRILEDSLEWFPASARVRFYIGFSHLRAGRAKHAIPYLEHCTLLEKRAPHCWAMLGDAQRELGSVELSAAAYRRAFELDPKDPYTLVGFAWLWARKGDLARADRHAEAALSGSRGDIAVALRMGLAWDETGHPERARAAFAIALEQRPEDAFANMLMAVQLLKLGDREAAERHRSLAGALAEEAEMVEVWNEAAGATPADAG